MVTTMSNEVVMYMFETTGTYFSVNWFLIVTQSALIFEMSLVHPQTTSISCSR